jgi:hypothetical protein
MALACAAAATRPTVPNRPAMPSSSRMRRAASSSSPMATAIARPPRAGGLAAAHHGSALQEPSGWKPQLLLHRRGRNGEVRGPAGSGLHRRERGGRSVRQGPVRVGRGGSCPVRSARSRREGGRPPVPMCDRPALVSSLVVVAKGPKHLSAVDATVARYTSDAGRLDDLYPFRGPLEVRHGQQCLGRPAEDLTGCDGPQLTGRSPCEGLVKDGLGLLEAPEAHRRARVEGLADRLDVSLAEAADDPLRLGGGNRGGAAGGWRAGSWRRTAASRATKGGEGSIPSSSARRFRRRW